MAHPIKILYSNIYARLHGKQLEIKQWIITGGKEMIKCGEYLPGKRDLNSI